MKDIKTSRTSVAAALDRIISSVIANDRESFDEINRALKSFDANDVLIASFEKLQKIIGSSEHSIDKLIENSPSSLPNNSKEIAIAIINYDAERIFKLVDKEITPLTPSNVLNTIVCLIIGFSQAFIKLEIDEMAVNGD